MELPIKLWRAGPCLPPRAEENGLAPCAPLVIGRGRRGDTCSCVSRTTVRDNKYTRQADKIGTVSSGFSLNTCSLFIWRRGGAVCGEGHRGRTFQASYSFSSGFEKLVLFWLQLRFPSQENKSPKVHCAFKCSEGPSILTSEGPLGAPAPPPPATQTQSPEGSSVNTVFSILTHYCSIY